MNVAIIPARGGSKRIPRKNIKLFCGKPMIAWPIEIARASGCFERIVVSTDDEEIAKTAHHWGAEIPFMRPVALADDYTGTTAVIAHAVSALNLADDDLVCCIYATAPFLRAEDLRRAQRKLLAANADYTFTVTSFPFPIQRALRLVPQGGVEMIQPEHMNTRSQDLEETWHDAGQFYWGKAEAWRKQRPAYGKATVAITLPRYRVQDIDTPEDWQLAEWIFHAWQSTGATL